MKKLILAGLFSLGNLLQPLQFAFAETTASALGAQTYQPKATRAARGEQLQDQMQKIQPENYDLNRYPVTDANETHWRVTLWATTILEPQAEYVAQALDSILLLGASAGLTESQQRIVDAAMQVGTQLYLHNPTLYTNVGRRFLAISDYSPDTQWVAMALSALAKSGIAVDKVQQLSDRVKQRFPNWLQDVYLSTTLQNISASFDSPSTPPLADLLHWEIAPQQAHLYVLCRPNREVLCRAVLKDRNGAFVQQDGKLWTVPLLLQSINNLDWNFTRGQTPQGIYRIEGSVPQPDDDFFRAYGQFPLVKLFMPFEDGVKEFLPGSRGKFTGNLLAYRALLPPSWQNYLPMQQSYWAGKMGRALFRIHGTGEAVDFFRGKANRPTADSYAWNPTLGCLSALELYDESGQLVQADMPKILRTLMVAGSNNISGYAIVANVPGKSGDPISLSEITDAIAQTANRYSR